MSNSSASSETKFTQMSRWKANVYNYLYLTRWFHLSVHEGRNPMRWFPPQSSAKGENRERTCALSLALALALDCGMSDLGAQNSQKTSTPLPESHLRHFVGPGDGVRDAITSKLFQSCFRTHGKSGLVSIPCAFEIVSLWVLLISNSLL